VQTENDKKVLSETGGIPIGIGKNAHIRKAIIDKNARIGENVKVFHIHFLPPVCHSIFCVLSIHYFRVKSERLFWG
jgi:NDP-sugar pyrophosphorylase family protein